MSSCAAISLVVLLASCCVSVNSLPNYTIPSCIDKRNVINTALFPSPCAPFHRSSRILLYKTPEQYADLESDLTIAASFVLPTHYCDQLARVYACNYLFPPCEDHGTVPVAICKEDCTKFILTENSCTFEVELFFSLRSDLSISRQCNATLFPGLLLNASTTNCVNISELLHDIVATPAMNTSSDPTSTSPSPSSLAVVVVAPIVASMLVLLGGAVIIVIIVLWCTTNRVKHIKKESYTLHMSNMVLNKIDDEESLFTLTLEDVTKNKQLKRSIVPFGCVTIENEIGHGSFGNVFSGTYSPEHSEECIKVAVKTIRSSSASYSELKGFLEESVVMCEFDHPHVLGLIGICLDPSNSPHLLLPFMENGDLCSYLKRKREASSLSKVTEYPQGLDYNTLLRICLEIAHGMNYLATKRLVHRDLAARNCMLDGSVSVRVADFGLTRDIYETDYYRQSQQGRVPVKWMAPESLHDRISNEKTDVWSYGVTCWEIFSLGRNPYPGVSNPDVLEYLERGKRLEKPTLCPEALYNIVRTCWNMDPTKRPSFSQLQSLLENMEPESSQNIGPEPSNKPLQGNKAQCESLQAKNRQQEESIIRVSNDLTGKVPLDKKFSGEYLDLSATISDKV